MAAWRKAKSGKWKVERMGAMPFSFRFPLFAFRSPFSGLEKKLAHRPNSLAWPIEMHHMTGAGKLDEAMIAKAGQAACEVIGIQIRRARLGAPELARLGPAAKEALTVLAHDPAV